MRHASVIGLVLGLSSGCTAQAPAPDLTRCTDPRPQICTQQYDPVCATVADGSTKTYATGCTACADPGVVGWVSGACDQP